MIVSFDRIMQSPTILEPCGFVRQIAGEWPVVIGILFVVYFVVPIMRIIQLMLNLVQHSLAFQANAFAASLVLNVEQALTHAALVQRT
jgi:hypothetical protein